MTKRQNATYLGIAMVGVLLGCKQQDIPQAELAPQVEIKRNSAPLDWMPGFHDSPPYVDFTNDVPIDFDDPLCFYETKVDGKTLDGWAINCLPSTSEDSILVSAQFYENGQRHGPSFRWDGGGNLLSAGLWKDNLPHEGWFVKEGGVLSLEIDSDGRFAHGDLPYGIRFISHGRFSNSNSSSMRAAVKEDRALSSALEQVQRLKIQKIRSKQKRNGRSGSAEKQIGQE